MPTSTQTMKSVLKASLDVVWITPDTELAKPYFTDGFLSTGIIPDVELDLSAFIETAQVLHMHADITDLRFDDFVSDGESRAAARYTYRLRVKASGREGDIQVDGFYHFQDGRLHRNHVSMDRLGFMERIGAMPDASFLAAFNGEQFRGLA